MSADVHPTEPDAMRLGSYIKAQRETLGISLRRLAMRAGVNSIRQLGRAGRSIFVEWGKWSADNARFPASIKKRRKQVTGVDSLLSLCCLQGCRSRAMSRIPHQKRSPEPIRAVLFWGETTSEFSSSFRKSEWVQTLDRDSGRNKKMPGRE